MGDIMHSRVTIDDIYVVYIRTPHLIFFFHYNTLIDQPTEYRKIQTRKKKTGNGISDDPAHHYILVHLPKKSSVPAVYQKERRGEAGRIDGSRPLRPE